ncbi:MAG: hypothetical protein ACPGU0_02610 [Marinirhabdus sp.]
MFLATTGTALLGNLAPYMYGTEMPHTVHDRYAGPGADLRKNPFGNHVQVSGRIYSKSSKNPLPNATVKIWHLSPGSKKHSHHGHLLTNGVGKYSFVTDFPEKETHKAPCIYFEVSHGKKTYTTQLLMNGFGAYVTGRHWAENKLSAQKQLPSFKEKGTLTTIQFYLTL